MIRGLSSIHSLPLPGRLSLVLLITALAACVPQRPDAPATAAAADNGASYAVFDYFEYTGRDPVFEKFKPGADEYQNPVLAGYYPDPSNVRVGEDYYLVNSSFCHSPGLPLFHSRDLVHWTQLGNIIERPSQLDCKGLGLSRGIFAPDISYHDGAFYLVTTCVDCGGNFVMTARDPAGPWSDPVWLPEVGGIDTSLFFDDDGSAWIVNNEEPVGGSTYSGHRALWVQRFDPRKLATFGPRKMIINGGWKPEDKPIWIDGPHIFRHDGRLYLIAAEGGTSVNHSQVVFKADRVEGPWTPYPGNPILTQRHLGGGRAFPVTSTGHADFVETPDGHWWATFLATRPYRDNLYNTGRETFLMPVRWVDDWPVITAGLEQVPYVAKRPHLPDQAAPAIPTTGNFTVREEFDGPLPAYWMQLRAPEDKWYDLKSQPGSIRIKARADSIGALAQPSYLGRRQQHAYATASTAMRYAPKSDGARAGLVAMQNDEYYYFFGIENADGAAQLVLRKRAGSKEPVDGKPVKSMAFPAASSIELRIEARGEKYDFRYRSSSGDWILFAANQDGAILSTEIAGGFVGATIGMYAYSPE
ncbi:MAG TPA: glycoside hydrolase family 43 protein [Gammaproteobacteria bacterium]|nr:glycoside hydrolase family 43 protein [Gammaproteobacteria bacterium]